MRKGRNIVAARWYVSFAVAMLALGLPHQFFDDPRIKLFCVALAALSFVGAAYELWWRRDAATPPKPRVRLEIRRDSHTPEHTYVVAMNDGDLAAINITGECVLKEGSYAIEFGPANVGASPEAKLVPVRLFCGGQQLQTRDPRTFSDPPPECEFRTDVLQAFLDAARGTFTGGDGRPFVGSLRPEPLAHKFNITYTDPDKRERFNRTHVLRYDRGPIRIDLDDAPDPTS
jgi:hypothetical protein